MNRKIKKSYTPPFENLKNASSFSPSFKKKILKKLNQKKIKSKKNKIKKKLD